MHCVSIATRLLMQSSKGTSRIEYQNGVDVLHTLPQTSGGVDCMPRHFQGSTNFSSHPYEFINHSYTVISSFLNMCVQF